VGSVRLRTITVQEVKMKRSFVTGVVLGALVAGIALSSATFAARLSPATAVQAAALRLPPATPAGQTVLYGHVRTLGRKGGRDVLFFDPALWLEGIAAKNAAAQDKAKPKGRAPNQYYIVDEGRRLLTFVVAKTAQITILTKGGSGVTTIGLPEFAQLLKGKNPKKRPLVAPLRTFAKTYGFWIRMRSKFPNAVRSIDQQPLP
jgi:hypothetical protein